MESKGYAVTVFNRTTSVVDKFIDGRAKGLKFIGFFSCCFWDYLVHVRPNLSRARSKPHPRRGPLASPLPQPPNQLRPQASRGQNSLGDCFLSNGERYGFGKGKKGNPC